MKKTKIIIIGIVSLVVVWGGSTFFFPPSLYPIVLFSFIKTTVLIPDGNTVYMAGLINGKTPKQFRDLFAQHPNIDTIHMLDVPGSIDDDANLEVSTWLAEQNLTMYLGRYGDIASGGTDLFLAGTTRIVEEGAQIGVHSWAGGGKTATDFPRDHEYHQPYIEYYKAIGWSQQQAEDFYFYTIEAAPAGDIHTMTPEEIIAFNVATEPIRTPSAIVPDAEAERAALGLSSMSVEQAQSRGIRIETEKPFVLHRELQNK